MDDGGGLSRNGSGLFNMLDDGFLGRRSRGWAGPRPSATGKAGLDASLAKSASESGLYPESGASAGAASTALSGDLD